MSERYNFFEKESLYFISPTIVGWVDLFTKKQYTEIILNSLMFCQKEKGLVIHAWCIMSSHLHLIVSSEKEELSAILRDFKKHTNKMIVDELKNGVDSRKEWILDLFKREADKINRITNYKVWQDGNHPVLLDSNAMLEQRLLYIHNNPVESGLVINAEDYLYSSASDYCDLTGILKVTRI